MEEKDCDTNGPFKPFSEEKTYSVTDGLLELLSGCQKNEFKFIREQEPDKSPVRKESGQFEAGSGTNFICEEEQLKGGAFNFFYTENDPRLSESNTADGPYLFQRMVSKKELTERHRLVRQKIYRSSKEKYRTEMKRMRLKHDVKSA